MLSGFDPLPILLLTEACFIRLTYPSYFVTQYGWVSLCSSLLPYLFFLFVLEACLPLPPQFGQKAASSESTHQDYYHNSMSMGLFCPSIQLSVFLFRLLLGNIFHLQGCLWCLFWTEPLCTWTLVALLASCWNALLGLIQEDKFTAISLSNPTPGLVVGVSGRGGSRE